MTPKREKFCVEYLIDLNGTQAAIRAGYSERTAKSIGQRLLTFVDIQNRIKELRKKEFKKRIMAAEEVEALLADIARGETEEEVVVTVGVGKGYSVAQKVVKRVSEKERLKALELIGKRNQLFVEKLQVDVEALPIIVEDIPDE